MFAFKLVQHFDLMRDLLIVVPSSERLLKHQLYASIFIFCKHQSSYSLLAKRMQGRLDIRSIFSLLVSQYFDSVAFESIAADEDMTDSVCGLLTSLERHAQQQAFFEERCQIDFDTHTVKLMLLFVQRILKLMYDRKRRDGPGLLNVNIKTVGLIVYYLSSLVVSSQVPEQLLKYQFMLPHLRHLSTVVRHSTKDLTSKATELIRLMQALKRATSCG